MQGVSLGKVKMARRQHITLSLGILVVFFMVVTYFMSPGSSSAHIRTSDKSPSAKVEQPELGLSDSILKGGSIAPKLENATAK